MVPLWPWTGSQGLAVTVSMRPRARFVDPPSDETKLAPPVKRVDRMNLPMSRDEWAQHGQLALAAHRRVYMGRILLAFFTVCAGTLPASSEHGHGERCAADLAMRPTAALQCGLPI